jgi:hypothetical protein
LLRDLRRSMRATFREHDLVISRIRAWMRPQNSGPSRRVPEPDTDCGWPPPPGAIDLVEMIRHASDLTRAGDPTRLTTETLASVRFASPARWRTNSDVLDRSVDSGAPMDTYT